MCFSHTKAAQMKKFAESKSSVIISKLMFDQNAKLLVNNYIFVSEAQSFDINFDYNEQMPLTQKK